MSRKTITAVQKDARIEGALRRRHYLHLGAQAGWCEVLGADEMAGRYLVAISGRRRLLSSATPTWIRSAEVRIDEPRWWAVGVADVHGLVLPEQLPDHGGLLTTAETADELGVSAKGIGQLVAAARRDPDANQLTPLGVSRRDPWHFFAREVELHQAVADLASQQQAHAAAKAAREPLGTFQAAMTRTRSRITRARKAWQAIAEVFPSPPALDDAAAAKVAPSPDPLPLGSSHDAENRLNALLIGEREGWFGYDGYNSADDLYSVSLVRGGGRFARLLPRQAVLPWVLGVADASGGHRLVAYREGLG